MILVELGSNYKSLLHGGNDHVKFPLLLAFAKIE